MCEAVGKGLQGWVTLRNEGRFADRLKSRKGAWRTDVHGSLSESTFDALFEAFDNIDFSGQPQHCDWGISRLSDVEEIVEKSLPGVTCEQVKLVDEEDY